MSDDSERLLDIYEAIERIERHVADNGLAFETDELVQTWVVHNLQIIGEAVRAISPELKSQHDNIPWPSIIGMRNILVHGYFQIDIELVRKVFTRDLPLLKLQILSILSDLGIKP